MCVRKMTIVGTIMLMSMTSGCATLFSGTDQQILIRSNPVGASCDILNENNQSFVRSLQAPAQIRIDRSSNNLTIQCQKVGYHEEVQVVESGFNFVTLINFFNPLGGLFLGIPVDAMTGALWKYPAGIYIQLLPEDQPDPSHPSSGKY